MGIFDNHVQMFEHYRAGLQFRAKLFGGVPKDPGTIQAWLRQGLGIEDSEELRQKALVVAQERGLPITEGMDFGTAVALSEDLAEMKGNGFRAGPHGLYIGGYQVKAALKESANIVYYGQKLGAYARTNARTGATGNVGGKIARSYLAERIWVDPDEIYLGVEQPTDTQLIIGHVITPQGERSTLTYYDYVQEAAIEFDVRCMAGALTEDQWAKIWVHAQENGLGAVRSLGHGRFDVVKWERVN